MSEHRFQHLVARPSVVVAAFVPCPAALLTGSTTEHQNWMRQVYEIARARAEAVVRPSVMDRLSRHLAN
jgi:hypothetical protein